MHCTLLLCAQYNVKLNSLMLLRWCAFRPPIRIVGGGGDRTCAFRPLKRYDILFHKLEWKELDVAENVVFVLVVKMEIGSRCSLGSQPMSCHCLSHSMSSTSNKGIGFHVECMPTSHVCRLSKLHLYPLKSGFRVCSGKLAVWFALSFIWIKSTQKWLWNHHPEIMALT